jgi:hypothetical protein
MWQIFLYFYFIKKIHKNTSSLSSTFGSSIFLKNPENKKNSLSLTLSSTSSSIFLKNPENQKIPPLPFFIKDLFFKRISFFPTIQTQIKSTVSSNKNTTLPSYTNFSIIKKQNCCFVCPYRTSFLCLSCATTKKTKL